MATTQLSIGWYWDPDLREYFQHVADLHSLIPDSHEYLFQFIDFDLYRIETPLAQYLSCLDVHNDDGSDPVPDRKVLRLAVTALQEMHPYFKGSPVKTAYMLNRIFAGYILRHFSNLSESRQKDLFRRVALTKFSDYADPELCFEHSISVGSERVLDCLFTLQKKLRRWIFVTLDDSNKDLASLSTKRRSALYSIIVPSDGDGDDPILKIQANFAQRHSEKMTKKLRKWESDLVFDILDLDEDDDLDDNLDNDLDGDAEPNGKSRNGKVDMIAKITQCIDELYFNPSASIPGAIKEAIQLTSDVDDYDVITYEISDFSELLDLEVYRMIAEGLRIKRCGNCNKYFIPKTPEEEGCNRIPDGSARTCAQILKTKKKEKPVEEIPEKTPQELYRTAYKKQSARVRKGAISQESFDQWKKEGLAKKALVEAGQLSYEEYMQWLQNS